jgi:hypothetical protein
VSTDTCKAFLKTFDSAWLRASELASGLTRGGEVCESTYVFTRDGVEGVDATALLLAAGFAHDPKLDGVMGC